jgi:hypothetical protein
MSEQESDWTARERMQLAWLGTLPAAGALILVVVLFPTIPSLWLPGFLFASLGAYATSFIGVWPLLIWFQLRGWQHPIHYALAGFMGVLLPWWGIGTLAGGGMSPATSDGVAGLPRILLLVAAGIGAVLSLIFGFVSARAKTARPDP